MTAASTTLRSSAAGTSAVPSVTGDPPVRLMNSALLDEITLIFWPWRSLSDFSSLRDQITCSGKTYSPITTMPRLAGAQRLGATHYRGSIWST